MNQTGEHAPRDPLECLVAGDGALGVAHGGTELTGQLAT